MGDRAGHPVGPHDLHRLPAPRRVRRGRLPVDRRVLPQARHRLVRLAVGRGVRRLPGEVRRARAQGGLRLPDRRRPAARPARHRPHRHPLHRHVDAEADPARRRGPRQRQHRALPRHLDLPGQARGTQPADDQHPAERVPERARRLLRPRGRPADHAGRRRARRGLRRAAHHPRPRHVGLRPGRVRRVAGPGAARPRHPHHRDLPRRRRQEGLRGRARPDEEAAPRRRCRRRVGGRGRLADRRGLTGPPGTARAAETARTTTSEDKERVDDRHPRLRHPPDRPPGHRGRSAGRVTRSAAQRPGVGAHTSTRDPRRP
ncbi:hypothetical protein SBRY_10405 [Actinacidiphila bryophytorum]|uniref:Uncharacterized protein n=1 Tax=Actinacidiphila bryophytorum TaxID=1436133 RepID=A0A9W4E193_9ACTN|nr:hypothetical protein SBRY_10405 [Actinacidiphila bryophytorum]